MRGNRVRRTLWALLPFMAWGVAGATEASRGGQRSADLDQLAPGSSSPIVDRVQPAASTAMIALEPPAAPHVEPITTGALNLLRADDAPPPSNRSLPKTPRSGSSRVDARYAELAGTGSLPSALATASESVVGASGSQAVTQASPQRLMSEGGEKLLALDFKEADVINVLRLLAAEGGRNIVFADDVKGRFTASLRNVTWEQALDVILEARGLRKIDKGGVIRIVSAEQLSKESDALARADEARRKADHEVRARKAEAESKEHEARHRKLAVEAAAAEAEARGPMKEEVLRLSYADAGEVAGTLQSLLGLGNQPIEPCVRVSETDSDTKVEFRAGGGATSGPIAEPPFSQLFGPPPTPESEKTRPVLAPPGIPARGLAIKAHCSTNSLLLRLHAGDLDNVRRMINESLDVPLPQVKIEARMEILDRTALEAIGIQWGGAGAANAGRTTLVGQGFESPLRPPGTGVSNFTPANPNLNLGGLLPIVPETGLPFGGNLVNLPISALPNAASVLPTAGLAFGIIGTNFNVNLVLQALATLGKTRTVARPEIVTVENHRATMSLGEEIPYATVSSAGTQIQFKEALLKLEVIPTVIRERADARVQTKIKMFVVVENNSRGDVVNLGASGTPPAINKRRARTQVLMNEGERLVIGGVTASQTQNTVRKVPILGDIPVLGWLFRQRESFGQGRELVVFLTPSVLSPSVAGAAPGK